MMRRRQPTVCSPWCAGEEAPFPSLYGTSRFCLLALVRAGKKRATASAQPSFAGGRLPRPGDLSILTDGRGIPGWVIESRQAAVLPFREIPRALAWHEGKCADLLGWRQSHQSFFLREGARLGYAFSQELPVVFEQLAAVYAPCGMRCGGAGYRTDEKTSRCNKRRGMV